MTYTRSRFLSRAIPIAVLVEIVPFLFGAEPALAAPAISDVSAAGTHRGALITVEGSGFGGGPNVVLHDDFERGAVGQDATWGQPLVGAWDGASGSPPLFSETHHSGSRGFLAYDTTAGQKRGFALDFPDSQEFFISYWVHIPPGTKFPGRDGLIGELSEESAWKFAWLMDGEDGYKTNNSFDLCIPTYTGRDVFTVSGNSITPYQYVGHDWWDWNGWMRITAWVRTDDQEGGMFQTLSNGQGPHTRNYARGPTEPEISDTFNRLTVPGWIRTGTHSNLTPIYDDIYVAHGANARARIEIGNSSNYNSATRLMIVPTQQWSDGTVVALLPAGLEQIPNPHIFVVDGNNVPSAGVPLGAGGCTDADGDGECAASDCNDSDPQVGAIQFDVCGDGIDQDCDGSDATCADPDPDPTPDPDPVPEPQPECFASGSTWASETLTPQAETFRVEFSATPLQAPIDGVMGLAHGDAFAYSDLAAIVRFNPDGYIDARDGSAYSASGLIAYERHQTYRFRLDLDLTSQRYDAWLLPGDDNPIAIGLGLDFRTEQFGVTQINTLSLRSSNGSYELCDLTVGDIPAAPCSSCSADPEEPEAPEAPESPTDAEEPDSPAEDTQQVQFTIQANCSAVPLSTPCWLLVLGGALLRRRRKGVL